MKTKWFLSILLPCLLLAGLAVGLTLAQEGASENPDLAAPPSSRDNGVAGEDWGAQPAENETAAALKSLRISGSTLRPRGSDVEYAPGGQGGGCIYATEGNAQQVFNLPVFLPQGATVEVMRMFYNDSLDADSWGWFTVYDLYGNIVNEWSVPSSGSDGFGYSDTPPFTHTVDYDYYSYAINWRPYALGSEMQLCGFRIFHTGPYGLALPIISKNVSR